MSDKGAQRWLKCRSHTCCTRRRTAWWRWFAVEPQDLVVTHATQVLSYHCDICLLDQSVRKLYPTNEFAKTFPNDRHPQKSQNRNNRLSETRTHITRSFGSFGRVQVAKAPYILPRNLLVRPSNFKAGILPLQYKPVCLSVCVWKWRIGQY